MAKSPLFGTPKERSKCTELYLIKLQCFDQEETLYPLGKANLELYTVTVCVILKCAFLFWQTSCPHFAIE